MTTFFARFITGCDIHYGADIAGGVIFPHGRGVVIGSGVRVEKGCCVFQGTTMGSLEGREGFPHLKEGVNVYPGTVIAGDVVIGEFCRLGPNVYLTDSVASHTRVLPAKPHFIQKSTHV